MPDVICIKDASAHNLKHITVDIPRNKLVVVTGISGSGKSTLIFDILHQESQRQFMGAHGIVTDQLQKAHVDKIIGLSPSIAVHQHLTNRNPRSTVGTASEVYTYLRVLYARVGYRPCPRCGQEIAPAYNESNQELWSSDATTTDEEQDSMHCPQCNAPVTWLTMAHFSFNTPMGACPKCTGLGYLRKANLGRLLDEKRSIRDGGVLIWDQAASGRYADTLERAGTWFGFFFDTSIPIEQLNATQRALLLYGVKSAQLRRFFPEKESPWTVAQGNFEGIFTNLSRRYEEHVDNPEYQAEIEKFFQLQTCTYCEGERIRPESRQVHIHGMPIAKVSKLSLVEIAQWLQDLPQKLSIREQELAEPIFADLCERVKWLVDVGVGYLTLARGSSSLSGGEAQRLRLASLLGSGLTGVFYLLDEPTRGLHPSDTVRLLRTIQNLRDLGNTVIVIEHDLEFVRAADYMIELGPGAGEQGGYVVVADTPEQLYHHPEGVIARYLVPGREGFFPPRSQKRNPITEYLTICGARAHNLKNISVRFPLKCLIAVTGVSGSGKSSLVHEILGRTAQRHFYRAHDEPGEHDSIQGWQHLNKVVIIDQDPIGRIPRSNAATYCGAFTGIRETFAALQEAKNLQLNARFFSFNVPGGRCEHCEGAGVLSVNMHFLPTATVPCPTCKGRRFKRNVLAVKYRGYNIADVLNMTVEEALSLFQDVSGVAVKLALLNDVGLGYLRLGQPAPSLSGGEAQRVKLATELARRATGSTLYLLDEPTIGLHVEDTLRLISILHRLVDAGNTVIVIEHNTGVIKSADWIIDLGPEGGSAGGEVVAEGPPEHIMQQPRSRTGQFLREERLQASLY